MFAGSKLREKQKNQGQTDIVEDMNLLSPLNMKFNPHHSKIITFVNLLINRSDVFHLSDKVLTEGRGDPFPGVDPTVHPDSFLFLSSIQANLEDKFIELLIWLLDHINTNNILQYASGI